VAHHALAGVGVHLGVFGNELADDAGHRDVLVESVVYAYSFVKLSPF